MSSPEPVTPFVLGSVSDIFVRDFEELFRSVFEEATSMLGALPYEPVFEVFNAFEHLSRAFKLAREADDPAATAAERANKEIRTNLGQARRHLGYARFFCITHQILHIMEVIRNRAEALPPAIRAAKAKHQPRLDKLEQRFRNFMAISIEPILDPDELAREVQALEKEIEELTSLLNEFMELTLDLFGDEQPAASAQEDA